VIEDRQPWAATALNLPDSLVRDRAVTHEVLIAGRQRGLPELPAHLGLGANPDQFNVARRPVPRPDYCLAHGRCLGRASAIERSCPAAGLGDADSARWRQVRIVAQRVVRPEIKRYLVAVND